MKRHPRILFLLSGLITLFIFLSLPTLAEKTQPPIKKNPFNPDTFSGLQFRLIGPALTSGRISDIAIHPLEPSTWYVTAGSGGVWKTINSGTTWTPIFDSQPSFSIGCITIDPNFPDVVWVGTGENVSGRHVGYGDGIYKSLNGGKTWENMGLHKSEHISKILVDPSDSNIIYAAAEGPLWNSGGDRGVYKSTDSGKSWERSLFISDHTGVSDIAIEPGNPAIIYAAAYQRRRSIAAFMGGGPESGIYKSTDKGKNWRRLSVGLPKGHMGRIGLAISPIKPNIIYATIEATKNEKGFYHSSDRGESWQKRNSYISNGTGPHYYQEIYADPHHFDHVYQMDVWLHVTHDGGKSFHTLNEKSKHSDNHALAFHPHNPDFLLAGSDGGLYLSWDQGQNWQYFSNLPITQFYRISLDNALPFYNVHAGAQDNGSLIGPSRTLNIHGIQNSDWFFTYGADGYACVFDPKDHNIIYVQWQIGHPLRFDKKNGEALDIQPKTDPNEEPARWNWEAPIIISPFSHTRIYYASHKLYRSDDRGDSWSTISPDLTRNIFRYNQPIMDTNWSVDALWDHNAMSYYSTITTIAESPLQEGLLYVGTDDGIIQVSENNGKNWRKTDHIPGVPDFFYVNDIQTCLHDPNTVFAALDLHKSGDFKPYIIKSTNRGQSWTLISNNLPDRHIIWSIAQDHLLPNLLFAGTEFGIFFTTNSGNHWTQLNGNLPPIPIRDLEIQKHENDLVAGTFGRGVFILDDYSPLRLINEKSLENESILFPVKNTLIYIPSLPLNFGLKGSMGDNHFTVPNPPFGAVFTYYLPQSLNSQKQLRHQKEKELEKQKKPIPFPGWDTLQNEEYEDQPAIILTIKNADNQVIRRISAPSTTGFNRITWDLRYPSLNPTTLHEPKDPPPWFQPPQGPFVAPGTFTVSMEKRINGQYYPLSSPQSFSVQPLGLASLTPNDRNEVLAFQEKCGRLQRALFGARAASSEALKRIQYIKKAILDTPNANPALRTETLRIEKEINDILKEIDGDPILYWRSEPIPLSLNDRVKTQTDVTHGITSTNKQNYDIAANCFEILLPKLKKLLEHDIQSLEKLIEAAGAPWTPGRPIPDWKKE